MSSEHIPVDNCILCGSADYVKSVEGRDRICPVDGTFVVWRCRNCGLYSTEPRLADDELARHYGSEYPIYNASVVQTISAESAGLKTLTGVRRHLLDVIARTTYRYLTRKSRIDALELLLLMPVRARTGRVLAFPEEPGKVLDIGCGPGSFLMSAYRRGWQCYGVDKSCRITEHLMTNHIANIQCCPFEDSSFDKGFFDLVNMSHVLEHLSNPVVALGKVNRVLKPGGMLMITIPCVSLESRLLGTYWGGWDLPRHLYHFDRASIKRMLSQTGFELLRLSGELNPNNAIWSLKYLLGDCRRLRIVSNHVSVRSGFWQVFMWPWAALFWLVGHSGRIDIVARKTAYLGNGLAL